MVDRSFIYLQGQGRFNTFVENSNASMTDKSTTFDIKADNFVAKNIAFKVKKKKIIYLFLMIKDGLHLSLSN